MENQTKVGIGVMILKDNKVLIGKRKAKHGENTYSFPGGHLEYMERFEECIKREVREECGLEIINIKFLHVANVLMFTPKHYINICFSADWESGQPENLEPEKCEGWEWCDLESLPNPLFPQTALAIKSYTTGSCYYDNIK